MWSAAHASLGLAADILFLGLFLCYNIVGHIIVVTTIVNFDLYPVPALVLSIEEVSLFLLRNWSHSYVHVFTAQIYHEKHFLCP